MDAQPTLDSLLGRLTTILVDEAQLLGSVRGDVEFIRDEMESMNGLLLHLTEAQHRDHQVRAWMKQIVGLTRDCESNVELYIHYVDGGPGKGGVLGYLRRVIRFLRTVPVRHQIATRIQELKARARDVGDRRERYGVTVPPALAGIGSYDGDIEPVGDEEGHRQRRSLLLLDTAQPPAAGYDKALEEAEVVRKGMDTLIKLLKREPAPATAASRDDGEQYVRVFCVVGLKLWDEIALGVYQAVATSFDCKASVIHFRYYKNARATLAKILEKITGVQPGQDCELKSKEGEHNTEKPSVDEDVEQLATELQQHLKGKRFLILIRIESWSDVKERKCLLDALFRAADGCHPGSSIMITTTSFQVALSSSPCKIINATPRLVAYDFYTYKARKLNARHIYGVNGDGNTHTVFRVCYPNAFAMKLFLHLLYVNPNRTEEELQKYANAISECKRLNKSISKQVLMFCYNELPTKYRGCLLYLTIYPQGHIIRTTSLARRWVAEGLITTTASHGKQSALTDEAEKHLDVLFTRGFVTPVEIGPGGDIKSFTLHQEVREFITMVARDVNFVETNQPTEMAHHLSVHNRIGLPSSRSDRESKDIVDYLPSWAASPQWQLLKVLDLEACKGLKKQHLKSICKILLLRYLSLRNTDVAELPKQIKDLQCLETLDIRQTKVRMLAKKAIVLPLLKHFLAGHMLNTRIDNRTSEESISTVSMPLCIQRMKNMEILSHVLVNSDSELAGIAQLLKLRKLGVALHGKNGKLNDLFRHIEKLDACLFSLSIRIDQTAAGENHDAGAVDALTLPHFIKSLNICGIPNGLSRLVEGHPQLSKLTLSETCMKEDDLRVLGKLGALRCLRLQRKSYIKNKLAFKEEEFRCLNYLLVGSSDITKISFAAGAAPQLERIVSSFVAMNAISGLNHLHKLKKLELKDDTVCLEEHPNNNLELGQQNLHLEYEDGAVVPSSSSSAPWYSIHTLLKLCFRYFSIYEVLNKYAAEHWPSLSNTQHKRGQTMVNFSERR